jgi:hypothetical protein
MLSMNWSPQQILLAGASPSVIAAMAVVLSNRLRGDASTYHQEPDASHV